jgi:hypothetical protein
VQRQRYRCFPAMFFRMPLPLLRYCTSPAASETIRTFMTTLLNHVALIVPRGRLRPFRFTLLHQPEHFCAFFEGKLITPNLHRNCQVGVTSLEGEALWPRSRTGKLHCQERLSQASYLRKRNWKREVPGRRIVFMVKVFAFARIHCGLLLSVAMEFAFPR